MSRKLLQSTAVVGSMTLLSRILGFVRDMIFARFFGADGATDAFFVVFKIPNFLRRLFAEGAFSQAFVPVLSEYKETRSREELKDFVDHMAGTLAGILLLVTTLGVSAAPLLVLLFAPGFHDDPQRYELAADMLRLTFPYLFFISLTAFAGSLLNSFGRFAVPAFTPVWLNLCLIGAAVWLSGYFPQAEMALAWGVFAAGLVQLGFQIPFLMRLGLLPRPRWGWQHPGVRKTVRLMLPAIFGSSVAQINLLFDTILASFLVAGSVSWLYYSDRLVEFPLGIFGIALATVILPKLSREHARASAEEFNRTLDWSLRLVLLIGLPATLGLFLLAGPLLATLFGYGEFDLTDMHMATLSLMAYALGLPGFILVKVLAPGFYARQDTKTPVKIGIIAMLANMGMNLLFVVPLAVMAINGAHAGLALATALAAWLNAGLLYRRLRRDSVYSPASGWRPLGLRILMALLVMGTLLAVASPALEQWAQWPAGQRALTLAGLIGAAMGAYFLSLLLVGMRPRHFRRQV